MDDPLARYRPYLAMLLLFAVVLGGTILLLRRPEPPPLTIVSPTPRATATIALVIVDVRGAVSKPGVYTLPVGSRVQDVLAQAGGTSSNADTRPLNLARKLNDGEQLYVPRVGEATPTPAPVAAPAKSGAANTKAPIGKININTASVEELDALPGIGPALGQRIVDYRTQNGAFGAIQDLKKVRGIGDKSFEELKDLITVQ
jgi:competence protein ComEA